MLQEEQIGQPYCPVSSLEMLLRDDTDHGKITLQLGGRDPHTLSVAATIGTAYLLYRQKQNGTTTTTTASIS